MAQADFYLLPLLKSALKGRHFCDATDIIKNERAKKTFTKWLPGMFPTPLQSLTEVHICTMGLF